MWMIQSTNKLNNITRYFTTYQECLNYIYVFKDHWCNVIWTMPVKIDIKEVPYLEITLMEIKTAKQRAEDDLAWGFNAMWRDNTCGGLTAEQLAYVDFLVEKMVKDT